MDKKLLSVYLSKGLRIGKCVCLLLICLVAKSSAQVKITVKDAKEISYQATEAVKNLQQLLVALNDPGNTQTDFKEFFEGSVDPASANRVFRSKAIIVEDDVDPDAVLGTSKDVTIEKYLNTLDAQYGKSANPSIEFSNATLSSIKNKDYLYINVKFDSKFNNTHTPTKKTYPLRQRLATLRLENVNNKWTALIESITFFDSARPVDAVENNVDIYSDTSSTATVVTQESFAKEVGSFINTKQEEEKNKQKMYDAYVELAASLAANKQYNEALEQYGKAKPLKTFAPQLDKKIYETKALAAEYTYEKFKNKGDKAKAERRYELAIKEYQVALKLNSGASAEISPKIAELTSQLSLISPANSKLSSGLYDLAIQDCKTILSAKDNKKTPEKFPELFYIQGKAYEALIAQKPDDAKNNTEKALENYNNAILYFPNYLDARITRAAFFVKYKFDYTSAIADYDILILNALDEAPEKPGYLVTRAKFKDKLQNYPSALEDYTNAINLNKTTPSVYYDKGELLYRQKKYDEAQLNFDATLKLDVKYKDAYFYRGLNYVALKNNVNAGADFIEAEKLIFSPEQLAKVDSISNSFFLEGEIFLAKHSFVNADTAYNNAIKIRKGNARAWHGKAEIRLITALEAGKKAGAEANYQESIDLNDKAIGYDKNFSDAYYKAGLAYDHIAKYDPALKNYGEAIRSNDQNYLAFTERGNTYQILKKYDKAAEDYTQAIAILKVNYDAAKKASKDSLAKATLLNISAVQQRNGQALYYANDYTNALLILDQAVDNNNNNAEALYYRGLAHVQVNDVGKAYKDYTSAIKITPAFKYYYANGEANYNNKNYEQAIINYTEGIRNDSLKTLSNRYYLRGMSYFKSKRIDSTLIDFAAYEKEGVIKADSTFYADFGMAKLYADQDSSATIYLDKALTMKSNAKILYGLGCAYAKGGKFDKALEYFEKAFANKELLKDDINLPEKTFVSNGPLWKDKPSKTKYNQLKSQSGL